MSKPRRKNYIYDRNFFVKSPSLCRDCLKDLFHSDLHTEMCNAWTAITGNLHSHPIEADATLAKSYRHIFKMRDQWNSVSKKHCSRVEESDNASICWILLSFHKPLRSNTLLWKKCWTINTLYNICATSTHNNFSNVKFWIKRFLHINVFPGFFILH